jgi:hypothetical protein
MKRGGDGHEIPSAAKDERCAPVDGKQHRPMRFIYDGEAIVAPTQHPREKHAHRDVLRRAELGNSMPDRGACCASDGLVTIVGTLGLARSPLARLAV